MAEQEDEASSCWEREAESLSLWGLPYLDAVEGPQAAGGLAWHPGPSR